VNPFAFQALPLEKWESLIDGFGNSSSSFAGNISESQVKLKDRL
jgi:hypothetical protein